MIEELYNIQKIKEFHTQELSKLVNRAQKSFLYKDRVKDKVKEVEDLRSLPLTFYEDISSTISTHGLEKTLLEPPLKYWQTSGYTSTSKKFYFSRSDINAIEDISVRTGYIFGLRKGDVIWNLCAPEPYASGPILHMVAEKIGLQEIFTPLTRNEDIIKGLKVVSKLHKIDAICGTPIIYSIIGELINEPKVFEENLTKKLRKKLGIFKPFASIIRKAYLRGIDYQKLQHMFSEVDKAFFFGEILQHYRKKLQKTYPKVIPREVYGSTEIIVGATQISNEENGLSVWLDWFIPEIADPYEIIEAKTNQNYQIKSIPWWEWHSGLKGELIVTKNWSCLPLIRYPTGDLVEVVNPLKPINIYLNDKKLTFNLPTIKILGRSSEIVEFEFSEEQTQVMGIANIYSRQIKEAVGNIKEFGKVKWWDLYVYKNTFLPIQDTKFGNTKEVGPFTKIKLEIIPHEQIQNQEKLKEEIIKNIRKECSDFNFILEKIELAYPSDIIEHLIDIEILRPEEYEKIEREIEKRTKEGKSLGQIKPKQIHIQN